MLRDYNHDKALTKRPLWAAAVPAHNATESCRVQRGDHRKGSAVAGPSPLHTRWVGRQGDRPAPGVVSVARVLTRSAAAPSRFKRGPQYGDMLEQARSKPGGGARSPIAARPLWGMDQVVKTSFGLMLAGVLAWMSTAKPIIDVQVSVEHMEDECELMTAAEKRGPSPGGGRFDYAASDRRLSVRVRTQRASRRRTGFHTVLCTERLRS